jgi:hypothetical protein
MKSEQEIDQLALKIYKEDFDGEPLTDPPPPAPICIDVDDGPEIGVVPVLYAPAPPPPPPSLYDPPLPVEPPPAPPPITTYSTVSLKVPGAVKVPELVKV